MIRNAVVILACVVGLVVALRAGTRRDAMETSGRMFERAMANRTVRLAILVLWWWLGWHFLVWQAEI
jgi:D-alanyl-lipoteichoic acid acyltransferase DltB (MBOAT superfamily)